MSDEDSTFNLSCSQKVENKNGKHQHLQKSIMNGSIAREYKLCNAAGAPAFVYKSHYTNHCKRKEEYKNALSKGMGGRHNAQEEYRATEKDLTIEFKILKKGKKDLMKETLGGICKKKVEKDPSNSSVGEMRE